MSLVDTGSGVAPNILAPQLEQLDLKIEEVSKVVVTHGHIDHIGGLTEICKSRSPEIFIHENDSESVKSLGTSSTSYVNDGDRIRLGSRNLVVIHTPGHTAGGICLHDGEIVLTGDTAFPGGYFGRTDLPSGSWQELVGSLDKLAMLDVRIMLPGHGEPIFSNASTHLKLSRDTAKLLRC